MPSKHKQVLINLRVAHPPRDNEEIEAFLAFLIKRINMKIAKADTLPKNPMGYYCDTLGNMGATGVGILETSHTALHTWDEVNPCKFDLDLYSCSDFEVHQILTLCQCFDIITGTYMVFDRGDAIVPIEYGHIGEDGVITKTIDLTEGENNAVQQG